MKNPMVYIVGRIALKPFERNWKPRKGKKGREEEKGASNYIRLFRTHGDMYTYYCSSSIIHFPCMSLLLG